MQNFNYHTHTYRCKHADDNMNDEEYVKEFIKQGFKRIAFTDHAPDKDEIDKRKYMRMDYSQKDEYLNSINKLKEKYKDIIEIESGFEVEYLPGQEENLFELKKQVDKIVLGQHYIYAEDKKHLKIFRHNNFTDEDLIKYAKYIKIAVEKGIPDVVVHPDLYMLARDKFGEIEANVAHIICETAEKYQIPLEINLTEPCLYLLGERLHISYPSKEFWKIASMYNINVLYGIDAHFKEQIEMYKESVEFTNKYIGNDVINKMKFLKK